MGSYTEKILTTLMRSRKDRTRCSRVGGSGEPNNSVRLELRLYSVASHFALWFWCPTIQKSSSRFRRSRCTQKMIIFPNGVFSFRVLPLERTFSNTRVIISKLGGVYEDIRKSPNMFARRLRIPAARGPLFEYLLMQRARVLKISTLKASEKEKHIILKIYHKLQRDI